MRTDKLGDYLSYLPIRSDYLRDHLKKDLRSTLYVGLRESLWNNLVINSFDLVWVLQPVLWLSP